MRAYFGAYNRTNYAGNLNRHLYKTIMRIIDRYWKYMQVSMNHSIKINFVDLMVVMEVLIIYKSPWHSVLQCR